MDLFLDIETVPYDDSIDYGDLISSMPKSIKKEETKKTWLAENKEKQKVKIIKDRSINRYKCKIVAIAYKIGTEEIYSIGGDDEEKLLTEFQDRLKDHLQDAGGSFTKFTFIGHNIKKFDLPILFLRSAKYSLIPLYSMFFYNRSRESIRDTMEMGTYWLYNEKVSQKDLCRFFGRSTKDQMDGSKVYEYYKKGKLDKIIKYCEEDVEDVVFLDKKFSTMN